VNIPALGNVPIGDAHNGLCGGMVFTVRDLFERNIPVPGSASAPEHGSPLFNYIVADSLTASICPAASPNTMNG